MGVTMLSGWDGAMIERCTLSGRGIRYSATTTAPDDNNNDRGGTAPLTPSSAAMSWETTTTTTAMTTMMTMTMMMTTMTIASPAMIKSTGATVLVPHLARRGFDVVIFTELSCAVCKHADARAVERNRCADVRAFTLSQGRRDDGADGIIVGASSGDVQGGGRGNNDGHGNADDILC